MMKVLQEFQATGRHGLGSGKKGGSDRQDFRNTRIISAWLGQIEEQSLPRDGAAMRISSLFVKAVP
jgi:hypothetical protein